MLWLQETERTYVGALRNLVELYQKPLAISCYYPPNHPQRFLELKEVISLFGNAEDLLLINASLLEELERNAGSAEPPLDQALNIGAIFLKMGFALMLYSKYLANYNTANRTLKLLEENKKFAAWLSSTEEQHAAALRGQRLPSLLIQPVQRIPRYRMLLEELLKQYGKFQQADVETQLAQITGALSTASGEQERRQIKVDNAVREMKEAVRKIGEVAAQVNEAIREKERTEELFEMQQSLKGLGGRTLMDHERRLGVHKPPSPHSLTARQVTCSSDMLLCRRCQ